jgi:tRNA(fMet)-specific endonuclease VapC
VIHILDTDVFTITELPDSPEYSRLHVRVLELSEDDVLATSVVTYEEQTRGWLAYAAKSPATAHQIKAYGRLGKHLQNYLGFEVLPFDEAAGREFDRLRSLRLRIGTADLKIAAIAISRRAILLSRNLRDFQKIPGETQTGRGDTNGTRPIHGSRDFRILVSNGPF